ncbi:hypothetical protein B0H14DRAFT_3500634 [Mycena olivaceomarginata]|nr:hypothetical protein B0H14DRAFT_3500634 [Mycena olivaceomarginata]
MSSHALSSLLPSASACPSSGSLSRSTWPPLVSGLLDDATKKLTDQVVWATPTIVFLAIPYNTPPPTLHHDPPKLLNLRRGGAKATNFLVKNTPGIATDVPAASLDTIDVKTLEITLPGGKKDIV